MIIEVEGMNEMHPVCVCKGTRVSCRSWFGTHLIAFHGYRERVCMFVLIIKGSLVEKLPSYGDLKMQRVQYSNSSSSSAVKVTVQ